MADAIDWGEPSQARGGVTEQSFVLARGSATVPGILWLPAPQVARPPLVLLGHGGSGHKRSDRIVELAWWFAATAGIAALAIDGPYHGSRVPVGFRAEDYQAAIIAEGADRVTERMVGDWLAGVAAVTSLGGVDTDRVGYFGLSMATRYGLPTGVALGARLTCAVFGKFGLEQTDRLRAGLDTSTRIRSDAPRITAPVLFHIQWDDDLFTREGQLALFDLIGSPDKRLIGYSGGHDETRPDAPSSWRTFMAGHLVAKR